MKDPQYDLATEKKKVIPALREMMKTCTGCGSCLTNCVFHKYSNKAAKYVMKNIKEFVLSKNLSKKLKNLTKRYIWTCGICEQCTNSCPLPEKIPKTALIILLRGVMNAKNESPFLVRFLRRVIFRDIKNPFLKRVFSLAGKTVVPGWYTSQDPMLVKERNRISKARSYPKKGAEICFSAGCGHTWGAPNIVFGTMTILEQAGVDFITIGNPEFCCGVIYGGLGFLDLWLEHTHEVMKKYLELNPRPKKIILHCPGCYAAYTLDMSKWGLTTPFNQLERLPEPIEIQHVTEFVLQLIKDKKIELNKKINLTVTYNDNCSIGRRVAVQGNDMYDVPREILKNIPGLKLIESDFNRENSFCCGALATKTFGFGTDIRLPFGKDMAYKNQKKLFENMLKKNSKNLVVPCMGCVLTFEDAARVWRSKLGEKINVWELNELINLSMGISIPKRHLLINDAIGLSFPYIKKDLIKAIPTIIRNQGFRDLFELIKDSIAYLRKS